MKTFEKHSPIAVIPAKGAASIFLHDHDFTELIYVERGCGLHIMNEEKRCIQEGDILMVPMGVAHCIRPIGDAKDFEESFRIINILFDTQVIHPDMANYDGAVLATSSQPMIGITVTFLLSEYEKKETGWENILKDGLQILFHLLPRLSGEGPRRKESKGERENEYVNQAIRYYQAHYTQRLTVSDIARQVGLSKGYLQRLFKANTGQTLSDGITGMRIQKACELLLTTDLSVYEIASRVGFADCNQIHIAFKRIMGMTPKSYRTQNSVRIEREHEVI